MLALELLRNADVSVAAAGHRLGNRVEWVHVFETPAVTGMLRGGEFLLTTGIALAAMAAGRGGCPGRGGGPGGRGRDRARAQPRLAGRADRRLPARTTCRCSCSAARCGSSTSPTSLNERLVSGELATLRRAVSLQAQLREAAREGLGPAGLVAALGEVLEAQVLLERADRTPIASAPEAGLDVAFLEALDRYRQRLPTALHSRPVQPGARLHVLSRRGDELDLLAVDEAAFLLSVALAAQPPAEEVPSAERARLLQRLAEGRAGQPPGDPAAGAIGRRRPVARQAVGDPRPRIAGAARAAGDGCAGGRRRAH